MEAAEAKHAQRVRRQRHEVKRRQVDRMADGGRRRRVRQRPIDEVREIARGPHPARAAAPVLRRVRALRIGAADAVVEILAATTRRSLPKGVDWQDSALLT